MFLDLKKIEPIFDSMLANAPKDKLLEVLDILQKYVNKILERLEKWK